MTGCQGQDWASYQDWTPSTSGLGYVFIKATEGTGYVNPRYSSQLATARAGRVVVGHYHFVRPGPSMQAQADYFLRHLTLKAGDVLALDWEDGGVTGSEKDAFLKYLKTQAPGHKVVLYCNRDFWINRDTTSYAADGLWIADPDAPMGQPGIKDPWLFHQYGSPRGMDVDYCRLDAAALAAWAAGATPKPPAPPTPPEDPLPEPIDLWAYRNKDADAASVAAGHGHIPDAYGYLVSTATEVKAMHATITTLAGLVGKNVDTAAVVAAVDQAIAKATVNVHVDVTGTPTT